MNVAYTHNIYMCACVFVCVCTCFRNCKGSLTGYSIFLKCIILAIYTGSIGRRDKGDSGNNFSLGYVYMREAEFSNVQPYRTVAYMFIFRLSSFGPTLKLEDRCRARFCCASTHNGVSYWEVAFGHFRLRLSSPTNHSFAPAVPLSVWRTVSLLFDSLIPLLATLTR